MELSIIVPFRADDSGYRQRAYEWCYERYRALSPTHRVEILSGGDGAVEGDFNKARAVNRLVEQSSGDVLLLGDADCAVDGSWFKQSFTEVWNNFNPVDGSRWCVASQFYYLTAQQTEVLLEQPPAQDISLPPSVEVEYFNEHHGPDKLPMFSASVGGHVMVHRNGFDCVGGMDERFTAWGPEDVVFAQALVTLWGEMVRVPGPLVHLWHPAPPTTRPWSEGAAELLRRYSEAVLDPEKMKEVIRDADLL